MAVSSFRGMENLVFYDAEAPTLLHFGQQSSDEFFVSEQASVKGITITNTSKVEPLVVLKHFGPNCPGCTAGST